MRQAIDEGFIVRRPRQLHDLQDDWRIEKTIADDPAYKAPKAKRASARLVVVVRRSRSQQFASLHQCIWPGADVCARLCGKSESPAVRWLRQDRRL
jgi:hypothetical protein